MSSMNRSSGGAGARPMYSTYLWSPTRVYFVMPTRRIKPCSSVAAPAALVWGERDRVFVADPVAGGESAEAGFEVERQPAGQLRMGIVLPKAIRPPQGLEVGNEFSHSSVLGCDAASGGEVQEEGEIEGDVEGDLSQRAFEPDQSGDLPAERRLLARLAGEQMVDADAGGLRSRAFGVQPKAGHRAGRGRAAPLPTGEPPVLAFGLRGLSGAAEVGL